VGISVSVSGAGRYTHRQGESPKVTGRLTDVGIVAWDHVVGVCG